MNRRQLMSKGVRATGAAAIGGLLCRPAQTLLGQQSLGERVRRAPATGPLRVLKSNPRYFTDGSGKAIYLAGSHSWWNLQDNGIRLIKAEDQDPPPVFDYNAYL